MKLLYFARIRQLVGKNSEEVDLPADLGNVNQLIDWLKQRDLSYESAFADLRLVRVAINQIHAAFSDSIQEAYEIAFFPPVTGG